MQQSETVEWTYDSVTEPSGISRDRCLRLRLGSSLSNSGTEIGGPLEPGRVQALHKLQGAVSSLAGTSSLCFQHQESPHPHKDGQHLCCGIPQSQKRSPFKTTMQSGTGPLAVVPGPSTDSISRAPARDREHSGRYRVTTQARLFGMGARSGSLSQTNETEGSHEVDLFASRLSTKLPRYYSWRPDPGAEAVNALTQNWTIIRGYAFPPFCLIGRCLTKIQTEGVPHVLLITPLWKSQPWFPILTSMVADIPVLLPMSQNILKNPRVELHPLAVQGHLQLVAWSVSGIPSKVEAFQKKLSRSSAPLGEPIRNQPTPVPGRYGGVGVPNMASIPFQHL